MADLLANGIDVYPQKEFDEDPEDRLVNEKFRVSAGAVPGPCSSRMSWGSLPKGLCFLPQAAVPCPWGLASSRDPARAQSRMRKAWGEGVLSTLHLHPCQVPSAEGPWPLPLPQAQGAEVPAHPWLGQQPFLGWNFTCRLPAAGNSVLQESAWHSRVD